MTQEMYCIKPNTDNPFFNLAVEEILLKNRTEDFIILGINNTSIIIGKHQNAYQEINTRFIKENRIPVIRRISGGGTVFHDKGNLNFSFIRQSESGKQVDFRKYTQPVIDFLSSAGINTSFEGKSDLKINGFKISGNAEHVYRNRVLHHGTLLYDASMDTLRNSLRKDRSSFISKAVVSNPSPVTNIKEMLPQFENIHELRTGMMEFFLKNYPDAETYEISEAEKTEAESLVESKYLTWEWNYAYSPEFEFTNTFQYMKGQITVRLYVKGGIVWDCLLEGSENLSGIDKKLIGCKYTVEDIRKRFLQEKITDMDVFNFF